MPTLKSQAASVKGLPIFTLARSMHKILPTVESPLTAVSYALRGRQHYSEIIQLVAHQGEYKANGSIQICFPTRPHQAPLFWSLDIDSSFPLEAYQKLVSPKVAAQIQLFEAIKHLKFTLRVNSSPSTTPVPSLHAF